MERELDVLAAYLVTRHVGLNEHLLCVRPALDRVLDDVVVDLLFADEAEHRKLLDVITLDGVADARSAEEQVHRLGERLDAVDVAESAVEELAVVMENRFA